MPAALRGLSRLPLTAAPGAPGEASSWHTLCGRSAGARARPLGASVAHRHRSRLVATARSSGEASEGGSGQGKLQGGGQLGGRLGALLRDIPARGRGLLLLNLLVRLVSSCRLVADSGEKCGFQAELACCMRAVQHMTEAVSSAGCAVRDKHGGYQRQRGNV